MDLGELYPTFLSDRSDHVVVQVVDLSTGELMWPRTSDAKVAGKLVAPNVGLFSSSRAAWSAETQRVGLTYVDIRSDSAFDHDVHFILVDPLTGEVVPPNMHLNPGASRTAQRSAAPQVTWDGEEFLVMWNGDENKDGMPEVRMTKLDGHGNLIGAGDLLYPHEGEWTRVGGIGRAIVGHDRTHAVVYAHKDTAEGPTGVWLCIEPPYE
jgi:hypothetical protein